MPGDVFHSDVCCMHSPSISIDHADAPKVAG